MCVVSCGSSGLRGATAELVEFDCESDSTAAATHQIDSIATDLTGDCPAIDVGAHPIAADCLDSIAAN